MTRRMSAHDLLPIGAVAERSGISVPTLRFYEEAGLLAPLRTEGNQRRYPRHVLRRLAYIKAAQRFGLSLAEIGAALEVLPQDEPPTKKDWKRLSRTWRDAIQARIDELVALRDTTNDCIACGCLATKNCAIYNPEDIKAEEGPGARRWPGPDATPPPATA